MNLHFKIRGRPFNVRTNDDGEQLKKMAEDLDQRVQERANRARKLDEYSVAIITALDLMHEFQLEKEKLMERVADLEKEVDSTIALVESLLPKK